MKALGMCLRSLINLDARTIVLVDVPLDSNPLIPIDPEIRATNGENGEIDYHLGYADQAYVRPEMVFRMTLLFNAEPSPCSPDA
jgi:hypothetical protein